MDELSVNGTVSGLKLGINGLGRVGKLTLWHHIARRYFDEVVVNVGRDVGTSLRDLAHYLERDSTYGPLGGYLHGYRAGQVIRDLDEGTGSMTVDGLRVKVLRRSRNPREIGWHEHGVRLVVDTTGEFRDPTVSPDDAKGSLRGHLEAGVERVIVSAPFKVTDKSKPMPDDAVTTVMGINENDYDPRIHTLISGASCTTTCLAHMIKPLLDFFGSQRILTASMATVHAVTSSQEVLDRLPKSGAGDLRKSRSILNNIILTTTGAADTLGLVLPEMKKIGFIAESVRIPNTTGSLIILVVNLQEERSGESIRREAINNLYREASIQDPRAYLHYTEEQNVSSDIIGLPRAAAIIEGHETHTRTAEVSIDLQRVSPVAGQENLYRESQDMIKIAITQAVIYGWYDNELGSYVNMLGDRTVSVAEVM
ncbi:MAG: glyceraldehyde 3-phosphate dehydrogenase NAD-binding domain-containing protein [Thermodesulfobacteriota bacterium]|nr:glyceraldehyde 3-phosphate dehydrogenase NAD-binding domain-containing protein [Thermodesulfobacteriota bacterium]